MENIKVNTHSSIKIADANKNFYFDPYEVKDRFADADYIFITHDHYDHLDVKSIANVVKDSTIFVCPISIAKALASDAGIKDFAKVYQMTPYDKIKLDANIEVEAIPAYNIAKPFHMKNFGWLGFVVNVNGTKYYVAGDTDLTDEAKNVLCDVAIVPIGGTYTMDYKEAATLINTIKPKIAVPTHYGSIVGEMECGLRFASEIDDSIEVKLLIKAPEKVKGGRGGCSSGCGSGCGYGCR